MGPTEVMHLDSEENPLPQTTRFAEVAMRDVLALARGETFADVVAYLEAMKSMFLLSIPLMCSELTEALIGVESLGPDHARVLCHWLAGGSPIDRHTSELVGDALRKLDEVFAGRVRSFVRQSGASLPASTHSDRSAIHSLKESAASTALQTVRFSDLVIMSERWKIFDAASARTDVPKAYGLTTGAMLDLEVQEKENLTIVDSFAQEGERVSRLTSDFLESDSIGIRLLIAFDGWCDEHRGEVLRAARAVPHVVCAIPY